ncbi:MAG: acetylxylan esterase [Planctomycetaceae bacterium]|nr:acetylxylan esterase [Planctomycetaceae bacterium]
MNSPLSRREVLHQLAMSVASGAAAGASAAAAGTGLQQAEQPRLPEDIRLGKLKDLNGYFPFVPSASVEAWEVRKEFLLRQLQMACGLWPMPPRPAIEATVHGRVDRNDYTVDRVFFESSPGLFVTGSLYRPKGVTGPRPTILSPHGHWRNGRFYDVGDAGIRTELETGAETFAVGGRNPLQARSVQLARMGCNVFLYDMQGYADGGSFTQDLIHGFARQRPHLSGPERWGLFSAQSELRLLNALGIQTWNSLRAVDWLTSRDDVDSDKLGVTGASGGGTQTFMLAALDERIAAAFPAVMVSTAMQGGCTCENASYLRVHTGNIEFAALIAPRPVFMSGANDWTKDIESKGLPELRQHFRMLGVPDHVHAKWFDYPHNFNQHSRAMMYDFFNEHLDLGFDEIVERDYVPLSQKEATVWTKPFAAPERTEEAEVAILRALDAISQKQIAALTPTDRQSLTKFRAVVGGAWEAMIGRRLPGPQQIVYEQLTETERNGYRAYTALLKCAQHQESLPTVFLYPERWNRQVVIVVGEDGKAGLLQNDGTPTDATDRLLQAGFAIASSDLLYQGEFLPDGRPLTQSRVVDNPREFAGYTLGYNHPLFAQRVHDILSVVSYVRHHGTQPQAVHLMGLGQAGPLTAAAAALSREVLSSVAIGTRGYRFGTITDIRDVNLLPGAVRYGDLPAVLALIAPTRLWLSGEGPSAPATTAAAYQAAAGHQSVMAEISVYSGSAESEGAAAVQWLIRGA